MELLEDIQSDEVFTQFTEVEMAEGLRPEQFDSAQLRDHNLTQAWRDVQVMVGQKQDGVSQVFPHFMIMDTLLYCVTKNSANSLLSSKTVSKPGPLPLTRGIFREGEEV